MITSMMPIPSELTILAIDTSCDETSAAVVRGTHVLSNIRYTQVAVHSEYGGVVPSIAKLHHELKIDDVTNAAVEQSGVKQNEIDMLAVTYGPGLAIALEVGISKARSLALEWQKPLIAVNHMEGHLLSVFADRFDVNDLNNNIETPAIGLLVSGKHSELVLINGIGEYKKIGETQDDACGEAFDKAARMMGLAYPGGPEISNRAAKYRDNVLLRKERDQQKLYVCAYTTSGELIDRLPLPMATSDNLDMSYSGLKTAFKHIVNSAPLTDERIGELCVLFEAAALDVLVIKLTKAINIYNPKEVWLGGGVGASQELRRKVNGVGDELGLKVRVANDINLLVDNAAMIGIAAATIANRLGIDLNNLDPDSLIRNKVYVGAKYLSQLDRDPGLSISNS